MTVELHRNSALGYLATRADASVDLIYIDPPFNTGKRQVGPRGQGYDDSFGTGFMDFLRPHLEQAHRVLKPTGSLYLHLDPGESHYAKVELDRIFGRPQFRREIIWRIGWVSGYKAAVRNWVRNHDVILYYTRSGSFTFNKTYLPHAAGRSIVLSGRPRRSIETPGIPLDDVWNGSQLDILNSIQIVSGSREKTGYPTQKPLALLERIISSSSNPGDLVLDFFAGSGTTGVAARSLGRDVILVDSSDSAFNIIRKRLDIQ